MNDPFFAIRYDTEEVRFENIPISLIQRCPNLQHRYTGAWVYGHTRTDSTEYFIISGLMESFDETTAKKTGVYADETGIIVALHGSVCNAEAQDDLYWSKNDPVWNMSETAFNQLVSDIFQRYTKAFGDPKSFLRHLPPNRKYLHPELRKQVELLEKQQ